MKSVFSGLLLACLIASDAAALSCVRPEPAVTFNKLKDDPDPYYIMHGTLTFEQSLMPEGVVNETRTPPSVSAHFVGTGLTNGGFDVPLDRLVTLQPVCYGPWCGSLQSGQSYLVFARAVADGITLEIDPCGTTTFTAPSQDVLDQMAACMNGAGCLP